MSFLEESFLHSREFSNIPSGKNIHGYTSNVTNYSGIFDKNNSYLKFDFVYNTGDRLYYYAREDLVEGAGVSVTSANRFSFENTAPQVQDHKHSPSGYYLYDEHNNLGAIIGEEVQVGHTVGVGGSLSGNDGNYKVLAIDTVDESPQNSTGTLTGAMGLSPSHTDDWYISDWMFRTMLGTDSRELASILWKVQDVFDYADYVDDNDDLLSSFNSAYAGGDHSTKIEYGRSHWINYGINQSRTMPVSDRWLWNEDFGRIYIAPSHEENRELWFALGEGDSNNVKWLWASTGTMGPDAPNGKGLAWLQDAGDGSLGPTGWTHWEEDIYYNSSWSTKIRVYNYADQKWYGFKGDGVNGKSTEYTDITSRMGGAPSFSGPTETQDYESKSYAPTISQRKRLWLESADSSSWISRDEAASSAAITLDIKGSDPSSNPNSWSNNLFFFDADYGSTATFKANNRKYEFGNGYYILQPKNINSLSAEFDLTFKNRTNREANAIVHFLENHQGQHEGQSTSPNLRYKLGISGFRWDGNATYHPYDSIPNQVRQFYCSDWSHSLNFDDSNDVSLKLRNLNSSILKKSEQLYVNKADTYSAGTSYELNDVAYYTGNHQHYYWHNSSSSSNKAPAEASYGEWNAVSGYYVDINTGHWTRDFFWRPSIGLSVDQSPRLQSLSLGGGYTQVYNDGINESLLNLNLNFNGRDDQECSAILHFLESHQGCVPFRYCPPAPYDKVSNYVCEEWSHSYDYKNSHSVSAQFHQYPFDFSASQYSDITPPPQMASGKLLFTSPLSFVEAGGTQDVITGDNVKARMYVRNIGDHDINISSASLQGTEGVVFGFVGQTASYLPMIKPSSSTNDYVIRNPVNKGLPFGLDGKYMKIGKSYSKDPQGGQYFTLVTGDEAASLPYRNVKVVEGGVESNDVYFQNNLGQITKGIELGAQQTEFCNYYMVESLFTGKYETSLAGGEEGYVDIFFSGATESQVEVMLCTGYRGKAYDQDRLKFVDTAPYQAGTSTGYLKILQTDQYQFGEIIVESDDRYSPQTGELRVWLSTDKNSDEYEPKTII